MKNDLKKKFLDILFEPEDEVIEEKEYNAPKATRVSTPREETTIKTPKASDLIYSQNKPQVSKSFIDLEEKVEVKVEKPSVVEDVLNDEKYELKRNISPIFGNIENKKTKKEEPVKKPQPASQSVSSVKEYTGIVLSPIFGYDNSSAEKARMDFMKNKKKDSALLTKEYETNEVKEVKSYEEPISLFDEPFDEPIVKDEVFEEPFTTEIKVIDIEGEPIEEIKEDYDEEETVKSYELDDLDDLGILKDENLEEEITKKDFKEEEEDENIALFDMDSISSANAKSFIDDLLGDKD